MISITTSKSSDAERHCRSLPERSEFELDQMEIDKEDFKKWYVSNSSDEYSPSPSRSWKEKSRKGSSQSYGSTISTRTRIEHFVQFSLAYSEKNGLWGVPGMIKEFRQLNRFRQIREGDLVLFMSGWKTKGQGGRVPFKGFKGDIERADLYRVATDYYYDESKVWDEIKGWEGETYPHRFQFERGAICN